MGPSPSNGAQRWEPITSINITPLVDVSLVLVIIFMLTMPFLMEKALKVNPAAPGASATPAKSPPITVTLDKTGILLNGQLTPLRELSPSLKRLILQRGASPVVTVSALRDVAHGDVVAVIDQVADAGINDLNLLEPPEDSHGSR
jgi:biopolymer transport protein ExbD